MFRPSLITFVYLGIELVRKFGLFVYICGVNCDDKLKFTEQIEVPWKGASFLS